MAKKLTEAQYAAIAILSLPKKGGLTNAQIAEQIGVKERVIYDWKRQDAFNNELKDQIMRNTLDRLPEVMASIPDHIIESGNAAMLRTLMQAHDMLTERVEVKGDSKAEDLAAMQARINARKGRKEGE